MIRAANPAHVRAARFVHRVAKARLRRQHEHAQHTRGYQSHLRDGGAMLFHFVLCMCVLAYRGAAPVVCIAHARVVADSLLATLGLAADREALAHRGEFPIRDLDLHIRPLGADGHVNLGATIIVPPARGDRVAVGVFGGAAAKVALVAPCARVICQPRAHPVGSISKPSDGSPRPPERHAIPTGDGVGLDICAAGARHDAQVADQAGHVDPEIDASVRDGFV